jgi:cobalt/nickel transport system permease protein
MHISEGILSGPVLFSGAALAAVGTAVGLKKLDYDRVARTGILSAAFFVASLIHVPVGPASVHLILNGILGLLLGWCAFPAILVALLLQALFFQFGGLTSLGVNTVVMAFPSVICYYLFSPFIKKNNVVTLIAAYACGFLCVFFSAILLGVALFFTEEKFMEISMLVIISNLPIMIIEGFITAFCVLFLKKVQPALITQ